MRETTCKSHGHHVDRCHLRGKHGLQLISRRNTFDNGQHKIESSAIYLSALHPSTSKLCEKTIEEGCVGCAERFQAEFVPSAQNKHPPPPAPVQSAGSVWQCLPV